MCRGGRLEAGLYFIASNLTVDNHLPATFQCQPPDGTFHIRPKLLLNMEDLSDASSAVWLINVELVATCQPQILRSECIIDSTGDGETLPLFLIDLISMQQSAP